MKKTPPPEPLPSLERVVQPIVRTTGVRGIAATFSNFGVPFSIVARNHEEMHDICCSLGILVDAAKFQHVLIVADVPKKAPNENQIP